MSSKSAEKLSTGYKINRASDDAAGLSISEKMRGQIRGLEQASKNIQDGISLCQTMDGGMQSITNIMQRQRELIIQALNDTNTPEDKAIIQKELDQLNEGIDEIANGVNFNGITLLNRSTQQVREPITEMITRTYTVPIYRTELINTEDAIMNQISATVTQPPVDSNGRFNFFATSNNEDLSQLVFGGNSPGTSYPSIRINESTYSIWNLSGNMSESKIRDTDMATEMVEYSKNQILTQAAQSLLSQVNNTPERVLQLLQQKCEKPTPLGVGWIAQFYSPHN